LGFAVTETENSGPPKEVAMSLTLVTA
jgi:hypothetical protein